MIFRSDHFQKNFTAKLGISFEKAVSIAYSFAQNGRISTIKTGSSLMTIREIAKDLYRLQQEVKKLEKELEAAPREKLSDIDQKLRQAQAARDRTRRILDGQLDR